MNTKASFKNIINKQSTNMKIKNQKVFNQLNYKKV